MVGFIPVYSSKTGNDTDVLSKVVYTRLQPCKSVPVAPGTSGGRASEGMLLDYKKRHKPPVAMQAIIQPVNRLNNIGIGNGGSSRTNRQHTSKNILFVGIPIANSGNTVSMVAIHKALL